MEPKKFEYVLTNRPFGFGCQPDGWTEHKPFMFRQEVVPGLKGFCLLVYPARLRFDELVRYEMKPVDETERLVFRLWEHYKGDLMKVFEWWPRYMQRNHPDKLRQYAGSDLLALACVKWLEGKLSLDTLMRLALVESVRSVEV